MKGVWDKGDLSNRGEFTAPENQAALKSVLLHVELRSVGARGGNQSLLNVSPASGYIHSGRLVSVSVCVGLYPERVCVLSHPAFHTHGTWSSVLVNSLAGLHTVCRHHSVALPSVANSGTGGLGTELTQTPLRTTWTAFSLSLVLSTLLI